MKKGIISGILFLLLGVLITGCNKDNNNSASDEQMQALLENAQLVMNNVNNYYEEAESVSDMALHLNEIKQMEDVEDAWQEDLSIAVKIKDGGIIKWCFFPHNFTPSKTSFAHNKIMNIKSSVDALCEEKSACISITVPYDEWRLEESDIELLNTIGDAFEEKDYSVKMVLGSDVTPSFIYNQLPQYGVNILITHGDCDTNGKHWIMTGVELNNATMTENVQNWMTKSEWISNRMQLWYVKESRNGEWVEPLYLAISEDCINEKMNQHFPKNSLMFAWACSTVKSNSGLWTILKNKGLGCYFGYDNPVNTNRAHNDLLTVMQKMLGDGRTAHDAHIYVETSENPSLILYPFYSNVTLWEISEHYFSASATKRVKFSPGNLAEGGRSFVANQWESGGYFEWREEYNFENWRSLTKEEWEYINSHTTKATGSINGNDGVILLPDNWTLPSECSFTPGAQNVYSIAEWSIMEQAGAIFLPKAGLRGVNGTIYPNFGYPILDGLYGYYWSSTLGTPDNYGPRAYHISFSGYGLSLYQDNCDVELSVRLVKDID